jgi:hypothetical protein
MGSPFVGVKVIIAENKMSSSYSTTALSSRNPMGSIADTRHLKYLSEEIKIRNETAFLPLWAIESLRKSGGKRWYWKWLSNSDTKWKHCKN